MALVKAEKPVPARAIDLEGVCFKQWGKASAELFRGCGRSCHLSDYINMLMLSQKTGQMLCMAWRDTGSVFIHTGFLALTPGQLRAFHWGSALGNSLKWVGSCCYYFFFFWKFIEYAELGRTQIRII